MLCPGSYKPIGRVLRREKTVCEVCGEECTVSQPTSEEERRGVQAKCGPHFPKAKLHADDSAWKAT
jgi:hypothetical protein